MLGVFVVVFTVGFGVCFGFFIRPSQIISTSI